MFGTPTRRGRLVVKRVVGRDRPDGPRREDTPVEGERIDRDGAEDGAVDEAEATAGSVGGAVADLADEERAERLRQLNGLIELMRPAVQADGGDLALISADVVAGVVEVLSLIHI